MTNDAVVHTEVNLDIWLSQYYGKAKSGLQFGRNVQHEHTYVVSFAIRHYSGRLLIINCHYDMHWFQLITSLRSTNNNVQKTVPVSPRTETYNSLTLVYSVYLHMIYAVLELRVNAGVRSTPTNFQKF
jgi:hypothetical protein